MKFSTYDQFCEAILSITNQIANQAGGIREANAMLLFVLGDIHAALGKHRDQNNDDENKINDAVQDIKNVVIEAFKLYNQTHDFSSFISSYFFTSLLDHVGMKIGDFVVEALQTKNETIHDVMEKEKNGQGYWKKIYFWADALKDTKESSVSSIGRVNAMTEFCSSEF